MGYSRAFPTLLRKRSGDSVAFQIMVRSDESGDPIASLSEYSIRHTLRAAPDAVGALLSKQTADGTISTIGIFARWQFSPEESAALPVGEEIFWDIQITSPSGVSKTLRAGRLIFDPQITTLNP